MKLRSLSLMLALVACLCLLPLAACNGKPAPSADAKKESAPPAAKSPALADDEEGDDEADEPGAVADDTEEEEEAPYVPSPPDPEPPRQ